MWRLDRAGPGLRGVSMFCLRKVAALFRPNLSFGKVCHASLIQLNDIARLRLSDRLLRTTEEAG